MKARLFILTVALLTSSANSFASHQDELGSITILDHSGGNGYKDWAAAANYAYQLASLGERYSRSYDYRLSNAANNLHYSASDLYRALRYQSNSGFRNFDHSDGRNGSVYQMMDQVGYQVEAFASLAPYYEGSRARTLYSYMNNSVR